MKVTTAEGNVVDLDTATAGAHSGRYSTTTVTYYHAEVGVYTPAPSGGSYVQTAVCSHNHTGPNVVDELDECRARLARIINREHRVPKWATLHG